MNNSINIQSITRSNGEAQIYLHRCDSGGSNLVCVYRSNNSKLSKSIRHL